MINCELCALCHYLKWVNFRQIMYYKFNTNIIYFINGWPFLFLKIQYWCLISSTNYIINIVIAYNCIYDMKTYSHMLNVDYSSHIV